MTTTLIHRHSQWFIFVFNLCCRLSAVIKRSVRATLRQHMFELITFSCFHCAKCVFECTYVRVCVCFCVCGRSSWAVNGCLLLKLLKLVCRKHVAEPVLFCCAAWYESDVSPGILGSLVNRINRILEDEMTNWSYLLRHRTFLPQKNISLSL